MKNKPQKQKGKHTNKEMLPPLICFFVLICFLYGAWFLREWERTKEHLVFFGVFGTFWGRMFKINSRTETQQKTFSKNAPLFWGGVPFSSFFLSFFISSFRCCPFSLFVLLLLQRKRHRKRHNPQKTREGNKTTLKKKEENKENTKTMNKK